VQIQKALLKEDLETIILGDFNIDYMKTPPLTWISNFETYNFTQLINTPTRVTDKSATIIDHVYTNKPDNISETNVPVYALSDHYPVCITRHVPKSYKNGQHIEIQYRDFKQFDEEMFLNDLVCKPFQSVCNIADVNTALDKWYQMFNAALDKHAPIKTKRVKQQITPKWITPEISEARHLSDNFHKKKDMKSYRKWRNKTKSLIDKAKENYYKQAIEESKSTKTLWKYLKELNPPKNSCFPPRLKQNENIATSVQDIVEMFNNFFISISSNSIQNQTNIPVELDALLSFIRAKIPDDNYFSIANVSESDVFDMLTKLNINKSSGLDGIGPRILKIAAPVITKSLTHIINLSIMSGNFPDTLKCAKVTPIFKKGEKVDPGNYRPISILPVLSKLFEKHVAIQVYKFFETYSLFHKAQSGFRKYHSCQTELTKLIDLWLKEMDNGHMTGIVFLDFKKAFDLVDHEILLQKLKCYRFDNPSLNWFRSYLSQRSQRVSIGNISSQTRIIHSGVPQGSVLGPLLFFIYINDLPLNNESTNTDLFADDATMYTSSSDTEVIQMRLNSDLIRVQNWAQQNRMVINEGKTKCMILGTSQKLHKSGNPELSLAINNHRLENVKHEKLVGVSIDNNLLWHDHIDKLCKTLSSKIALLSRIKKYLPTETRNLYYKHYILPTMDYCSNVWGNGAKSELDRIYKLQKRAARIILDASIDHPSKALFTELKWFTIYERIDFHKAVLLYKCLHGTAPEYLQDLFRPFSTQYQLRSILHGNLQAPKPRTEQFKKSFQYSGTVLWNKLPLHVKSAENIRVFKKRYHEHVCVSNR